MRKLLLRILLVIGLVIPATADCQTTIFDYGTTWKYLDNGSNQGTAWRALAFSDATWVSDTGFFGYSDPWITKLLNACGTVTASPSCSNKYITTYFRKIVNIPSIAIYDSVKLSVKRDDGVVIYVNGVEAWRDPNMPTGTITYTTTASTALGGVDEYTPITKTIPASYFSNGNNIIAVELHQQSGTSSDLGFNMQMIGIPSLTLFDYGSSWKYLDNGSNQGTSWSATGFNDATWASDTGFFGYTDAWITKLVNACGTVAASPSCTNKYITTYFRKGIDIPAPSLYDSVRFNIKRDDGVVVYVNGAEVWRDANMPSGAVTYTTTASTAIGGVDEYTPITKAIPISAFATGNNVIAVELHQQSGTSSDLGFNMQAVAVKHVAAIPVTLLQGPYLQMGNKTAVSVRWRTNIASKSRLQVGTVAGTYPITVNDATVLTEHELRVSGLQPDTKYFYRIGTDTSVVQGDTANFFVTAPADSATRRITIAAFGDCGRNDNNFQTGSLSAYQNYLAAQNMKAADLMLLVGDNAYDAGTDAEFSTNFFSRYSGNILKNHILFPAPGNHDYANNASRQADHNVPYFNLFSVPTAAECGGVASGTEAYYSYDWGNVHILSLDSYGEENGGTTRLYDTLGAQVNWIKNDLAANNKKWTIVYFHHPPYTMGSHNSDGEGELVNIRQNFIRILERYGVDMVICGHSHDYERSYLLKGHYGSEALFNKAAHTTDSSSAKYNGTANSCPYVVPSGKVNHGTVYVVSGSAGADGGVQAGYPHNALPFSIDDGGMFYIDIKDNRLDAKFLRRDNTIGDQFTIMKDAKVKDTVTILAGQSVDLTASWQGAYAWAPGVTTRTVSVTPAADTTIIVKDSVANTCLTDRHFVDVQCTMPAFTDFPGNLVSDGCHQTVVYTIADTARPAPVVTYSFSGATVAAGSGTGSGALFGIGVTTVVVTATNDCGSKDSSFMVTIEPLPEVYNVTGGGDFCTGNPGVSVGLSNSQTGVNYQLYNGSGAVGSLLPGTGASISFGIFTTAAIYTVVATQTVTGCTNNMTGSAQVIEHSLPAVYNISGGGAYCANVNGTTIDISNSQANTNYQLYIGASAIGSVVPGTGAAFSFTNVTTAGIYTVAATNTVTGCVNNMSGSAEVIANLLPDAYAVTGGGSYCTGNAGVEVGLEHSQSGISYQLYNGPLPVGAGVTVTGAPVSFGTLTASATYTVLGTNTVTGCAIAMSGFGIVTENPLPVVYNVTGSGSYCAGGNGRAIGLNNSQTDVNYQLYNGASAVGGSLAGSGSVITFGNFTTAATYSVLATDAVTGCVSNMSGNAVVDINDLPLVFSVTGGGSYCSGGNGVPAGLTNSQTGVNYQLYNGISTIGSAVPGTGSAVSFGDITSGGTYTAVATNTITGCASNMTGSAIVSVNPLPAIYPVTGGGNYCAGGAGMAIGMGNSQTGVNYQLFNGLLVAGTPVAGSGASVSFGLQTVAGTYTVTAINPVTSCMNNMSGNAAVGIYPLPSVYTVTGGGHYCAGGTGVHLGLGGSAVGTSYQLYNGSSLAGTVITGTGTPLDLGLITAAGFYSMTATNTVTGCVNNMLGNASIVIDPLLVPSVTLSSTGGPNLCAGAPSSFTAPIINGGAAPVYQWKVNGAAVGTANSYSYVPANGDVVSITVTSNATCAAPATTSSSIIMTVNPYVMPAASIGANPGNILCQGSTVTLNAMVANGGTAPVVRWIINSLVVGSAMSYSYTPAEGDAVILSMTSNKPCVLAATVYSNNLSMSVRENYIPVVNISVSPGIEIKPGQADTFKAFVSGAGLNPSYKWIVNSNVIAGATGAQFVSNNLNNNDSVTCVASGAEMCGFPAHNSVVVYVRALGIEDTKQGISNVMIMPNPNKGEFRVEGSTGTLSDEDVTISVTNVLGQVVYRGGTVAQKGHIDEHISLGNTLASGTYLLNISSLNGSKMFHFVVNR